MLDTLLLGDSSMAKSSILLYTGGILDSRGEE